MQQQSGSQYGLPPLEMGPGYSPAPQMIGIHQAAGAKAEAASPISSRPGPPGEAIFGELGGPARIFAEEESVMITGAGEDGERGGGGGGNRWPRQETLALLKFRSDMDSAFRDATLKGPLWEDVSRKLGELGYSRSAKKCKEKFENVHKYYKRTKEGRAGRQDGKSYRFFTQLEALQGAAVAGLPTAAAAPSLSSSPNTSSLPAPTPKVSNAFSASSSESSDGEETDDAGLQQTDGGRKRKRQGEKAAAALFKDLMKQLMERQEAMQRRFLEAIEKREQDRMAREEAWKRQEMARLNREYELMAQERTMAATRDAAVISFLQKFAGPTSPPAIPAAPPPDQSPPQPQPPETGQEIVVRHEATEPILAVARPTSRWPKAEVLALIKLRSGLDGRYMEAGPKGPLWEEISMGMKRLGYTRSTKRCKEKWENINKYFKKVKEGNKKRPEDAKTCPYFHELDALYRRKQQQQQQQDPLPISIANGIPQPFFGANGKKPEDIVKDLMEQGNQEDDDDDIHDGDDDEDEDEDYDDDDDDENGKLKYEIQFQRQPPSMGGGGSAASGASQPPVPPSSNAGSFLAMDVQSSGYTASTRGQCCNRGA